MSELIIIYCTFPGNFPKDKLDECIKSLLEKKLVACVNIIPTIESHYIWENKLEKENEILLMMKSQSHLFESIQDEILSKHPYDVPEIISTSITHSFSII